MLSGGGLDYVIISYVLIYCTDDPTADMLARLLTVDQVKAVLISERNQENEMIARMEMRQINVSKLMGQQGERDDRQMAYLGPEAAAEVRAEQPLGPDRLLFPNVPFEEHKAKP